MYMHNNHCHRATAHLQFIIIIIIIIIIKSYNNLSVWFLSLREGLKHLKFITYVCIFETSKVEKNY